MPFWAEVVVASLIGVGSFFMLVGSVALVKLPGTMRRLHGPTKATTVGIGALLLASMLHFALAHSSVTVHELLIAVFLLLTAPVSAHMIAKVWLLRESPSRQAAGGANWPTPANDADVPRCGTRPILECVARDIRQVPPAPR